MEQASKNYKIIKFITSRFGPLEITEDKIIYFPQGILGFFDLKRYILIDHGEDGIFKWLQALDNPDVAFLLTDPLRFKPDYRIALATEQARFLKIKDASDVVIMAMVCFPKEEPPCITLNLKGPVLFNSINMMARQIVLEGEEYSHQYKITS
ncbi:MAG: flagellar assembly protein FliW [Deltaproteobacteria bacterium]|nr:flagellar assembly protein FliW [Deltaproteobacteria bacterium]